MKKIIVHFKSGRSFISESEGFFEILKNNFKVWDEARTINGISWFNNGMIALHEIDQIEVIE